MVHRALDVNANGTRIHNRVCARVCYMYVRVHGAALQMCRIADVQPPGCRDYAAHLRLRLVITHELVVACSACARAL